MNRPRVLAVFAVVILALGGCAGGTQKPGTLTLFNDKDAWKPYFQQLGSLAKKKIGLDLEPSGYTDEPTYQATIRSSFQTQVKPDLFTWTTGPELRKLVERHQVADTTEIWDKAVANGDISPQVRQYYTVGGRQYCIPLANSYWGMFYNKHLFDRYGLHPPKTWDELIGIAKTLKSHGIAPFYETTKLFSFAWFQQLLAGSDPDLYQRLAEGKAKYTDPGVVAVMQRFRELAEQGLFSDSGSKIEPEAQLKSGKTAMAPAGTYLNSKFLLSGQRIGVDYDFFPIPNVNPKLPKTSVLYETGALCAPSGSDRLAEAEKFMSWWLGETAQRPWSTIRDEVSTNPKVTTKAPSLNAVANAANNGAYRLLNRYYDITPEPILTPAVDAFGAVMVHPDQYRAQLDIVQQAADDYWKTEAEKHETD